MPPEEKVVPFPSNPRDDRPSESGPPEWLKTAQEVALRQPGAPEAPASPEFPRSGGETAALGLPAVALPHANGAYMARTARPWFSLAAIVGREEHHIGRFLEAFEPLVDEIVLVRAIGSAKPDRSFEIALAQVKKPLFLAEYKNDPNLDWDHVDNFALARQSAFELAKGEFVMWADCDDILDGDNLQKLRAAVDLGNFDVLMCPYRVIGAHPLIRERVIKRGVGRWVNACHEAVSFPPSAIRTLRSDIEIFHYPIGDGTGQSKAPAGLARNIRILEHSVGPSSLAYFYLHRDSLLQNNIPKALDFGKLAIACPTLSAAERYRVFYNIAMIFLAREDWQQMETFAMNGIRQNPDRRECYCVMAVSWVERKNYQTALIWIQLTGCIRMPDPRSAPNWFEPSWYGWRANALHAYVLRKLGLPKEADEIEDLEHDGKPVISLLHATRKRPQAATDARERWMSTAFMAGKIEHIFAVDSDDKETLASVDAFRTVVVEPGGGCVRAWNAAAKIARGRVLIQMSDDWTPPHHWDNLIAGRMQVPIKAEKPAVLAISDGRRADKLLCMAILTRAQYKRQRHEKTGEPYLFHPDYLGVYSDNEFTVRAYENGVVIEAKDIIFTHDHPLFTGGKLDQTYLQQNSSERYAQGLAVFNRRNPRYKIEPPEPATAPVAKHFFDVGANIGQTFDDFLTKTTEYDGWHVWCLEPSPRHIEQLFAKAKGQGERFKVHVCPFGLRGKTEEAKFYLKDDPRGDSFEAYLASDHETQNIEHTVDLQGAAVGIERFIMEKTTEDSEVVLKLDCEGSEYEILAALLASPPAFARVAKIFVEFHTIKPAPGLPTRAELEERFKAAGKPLLQWMF